MQIRLEAVEVNAMMLWNNDDFSEWKHHQYGRRWHVIHWAFRDLAQRDIDDYEGIGISFFVTPVNPPCHACKGSGVEHMARVLEEVNGKRYLYFELRGRMESGTTGRHIKITTGNGRQEWLDTLNALNDEDVLEVVVMGPWTVSVDEDTQWIKLTAWL